MVTWGGEYSLWRSLNGGESWERIYSSIMDSVDQINRLALPPDYGDSRPIVFIAGSSNGSPAIMEVRR